MQRMWTMSVGDADRGELHQRELPGFQRSGALRGWDSPAATTGAVGEGSLASLTVTTSSSDGLCIACGAAVSNEAAVASDNLPAEGVQRVYGRQGRLCATCFLVGYRTVVGT